MEEYKRAFDMLVYQVRLYDPHVGGMMLVQRFILGLKQELRAAIEVQLPDSVAEAASFAAVQESVLERTKLWTTKSYHKKHPAKTDTVEQHTNQPKFEKGELWKAKQLKDYRRANGLCFKCGDKFAPGHQCPAVGGQIKALVTSEILYDDVLDVLVGGQHEEENCHVSLHALSGA